MDTPEKNCGQQTVGQKTLQSVVSAMKKAMAGQTLFNTRLQSGPSGLLAYHRIESLPYFKAGENSRISVKEITGKYISEM